MSFQTWIGDISSPNAAVCIVNHVIASHILGIEFRIAVYRISAGKVYRIPAELRVGIPAHKGVFYTIHCLCGRICLLGSCGIAGMELIRLHVAPKTVTDIHELIQYGTYTLCYNRYGTVYMVTIPIVRMAGDLIGCQNNGLYIILICYAIGCRKCIKDRIPCGSTFCHSVGRPCRAVRPCEHTGRLVVIGAALPYNILYIDRAAGSIGQLRPVGGLIGGIVF